MNSKEILDVKYLFPQGLPGFENLRTFVLFKPYEEYPFYYLNSEEKDVSFLMINPFELTNTYEFELPLQCQESLNIKNISEVTVFNIVNAREGLDTATVNLQAPVIINIKKSVGMQIVLSDNNLNLKEPLKNLLEGMVKK